MRSTCSRRRRRYSIRYEAVFNGFGTICRRYKRAADAERVEDGVGIFKYKILVSGGWGKMIGLVCVGILLLTVNAGQPRLFSAGKRKIDFTRHNRSSGRYIVLMKSG